MVTRVFCMYENLGKSLHGVNIHAGMGNNMLHDTPANLYIVGIILLLDIYHIIIITNYFCITLYVVAMTILVTPKPIVSVSEAAGQQATMVIGWYFLHKPRTRLYKNVYCA